MSTAPSTSPITPHHTSSHLTLPVSTPPPPPRPSPPQVRIARETTQIFVPLAQKLGIEALEYELLRLSVQFLFPQQLLRVPYGLELLGHWARLFFWISKA